MRDNVHSFEQIRKQAQQLLQAIEVLERNYPDCDVMLVPRDGEGQAQRPPMAQAANSSDENNGQAQESSGEKGSARRHIRDAVALGVV